MVSEQFRRQLRQEAGLWQAEGLIDTHLYQQLSQRYQFDSLETASRARFVIILISLGGILLGLGVITFVAANWQHWSREVKTTLLLLIFIASSLGGFYLWRQPTGANNISSARQRLGHGLLFFAALSLGANIGLMAQTFHLKGSDYELYLVWGLGVIFMAYGLRLTSLGVFAIILTGLGYWLGIIKVLWFADISLLEFSIQHMTIVGGLLFLPLAYWCNSRAIFVLTCLLVIPAFTISGSVFFYYISLLPSSLAFAPAMAVALLWGYDDSILPQIDSKPFQPLARNLTLWLLSIVFFCLSFRTVWIEITNQRGNIDTISPLIWLISLDIILVGIWTIWEWIYLLKPGRVNSQKWGLDFSSTMIAGFILVSLIVIYWHFRIGFIAPVAVLIFNLQMFLLAVGLAKRGLARGKRLAFWGGMILLTLQIISRTFEYNTDLLVKSLVFVLCGIGVMAIGLWFERHLASLSSRQEY